VSSVVVNVQVVVAPLLGFCVAGKRPSNVYLIAVPFPLSGVALASGVTQSAGDPGTVVYGSALALVAGLCYGT
jgi:drug/metabolite transporter (DMT)-like permease